MGQVAERERGIEPFFFLMRAKEYFFGACHRSDTAEK